MKIVITIAALAGLLASVSMPASAMPLVPGEVSVGDPNLKEVGWRCGPGRHFAWRLDRCVRNWRY